MRLWLCLSAITNSLEAMKADYLKHCFIAAKEDLAKGNVVDGEDFLNAL
ncbi:hypothetical protein ACRN91_09515 [Shewanella baltica]